MKLYYVPGACSFAPHIALREAGAPFDLVKVTMPSHTLEDGSSFFDIDPRGYVPVLEMEDGRRLAETPAVLLYIADCNPARPLAPKAGTPDAYRHHECLAFISSELHKGLAQLFDPSLSDKQRSAAVSRAQRRFAWIAGQLAGDGGLFAERFTVADAYLYTMVRWARFLKVDLGGSPALARHANHMEERPSVRAALQAEQA